MDDKYFANFENLKSFYHALGETPGSTIYDDDYFFIVKSAKSSWPNLAVLKGLENNDAETVQRVTLIMKSLKMHPLILAGVENFEFMKSRGYMPVDKTTAMYLNILDPPVELGSADERIFLVGSNEFDDWFHVVSSVLFASKNLERSVFQSIKKDEANLIGLSVGTKLVGSALIYIDQSNVAGIYMVAVRPEFRHHRLAQRIMHFCFRELRKRDVAECHLQSTKLGNSLYLGLGFQSIGEYVLYWKIKN